MPKYEDDDGEPGRGGIMDSSMWQDVDEDRHQAKLRGMAVLGSFLLCVALFTGGLAFPLVEVVIFPGSPDMETRLVKSVMNMISLAFQNGQYIVCMVMLLCTVGIPMVLLIGMLVIMYENFFAVGFDWNAMFTPATRALVVSLMYVGCSYQVVMIFLVMLFTCFFTGFGSQTILRAGFHFLAAYCLTSIGLIQAMDFLRIDDRQPEEIDEVTRMGSLTGLGLRRRFSSFFPSLPGIKETTSVDAFQVFFFQLLFLVLLVMGFDQPLLDLRVMYKGVALQRDVLSLHDIISSLASSAAFPVVLLFILLVVVIPVCYGFTLVAAGIVDVYLRCCGDDEEDEEYSPLYQFILCTAKILRPWVMIDVFCIALIIILYAVQNEYVSATIPEGIVHFRSDASKAAAGMEGRSEKAAMLQMFSGLYCMVGAGTATLFMRWFWSSTAGFKKVQRLRSNSEASEYTSVAVAGQASDRGSSTSEEGDSDYEGYEENLFTRYVIGKSFRCLTVWAVVCFLMHGLPPPQTHFRLSSMNEALSNSLPLLNKLLVQYVPQTIGSCQYPLTGIPQPCFEYGFLDKLVKETFRITAEWMSGLKTLSITHVSIAKTKSMSAASRPVGGQGPAFPVQFHQFELDVDGVIGEPSMFLRIEECPRNHTSLEAITGQGLCKPFLDTSDALVERNRRFSLKLSFDCHTSGNGLTNTQVKDMRMDTMTARPEMWKGNVKLLIADQNITKMVLETLKANMMVYLVQEPVLKFSGLDLNIMQFVNRVLRFNAPHEEFHCR